MQRTYYTSLLGGELNDLLQEACSPGQSSGSTAGTRMNLTEGPHLLTLNVDCTSTFL